MEEEAAPPEAVEGAPAWEGRGVEGARAWCRVMDELDSPRDVLAASFFGRGLPESLGAARTRLKRRIADGRVAEFADDLVRAGQRVVRAAALGSEEDKEQAAVELLRTWSRHAEPAVREEGEELADIADDNAGVLLEQHDASRSNNTKGWLGENWGTASDERRAERARSLAEQMIRQGRMGDVERVLLDKRGVAPLTRATLLQLQRLHPAPKWEIDDPCDLDPGLEFHRRAGTQVPCTVDGAWVDQERAKVPQHSIDPAAGEAVVARVRASASALFTHWPRLSELDRRHCIEELEQAAKGALESSTTPHNAAQGGDDGSRTPRHATHVLSQRFEAWCKQAERVVAHQGGRNRVRRLLLGGHDVDLLDPSATGTGEHGAEEHREVTASTHRAVGGSDEASTGPRAPTRPTTCGYFLRSTLRRAALETLEDETEEDMDEAEEAVEADEEEETTRQREAMLHATGAVGVEANMETEQIEGPAAEHELEAPLDQGDSGAYLPWHALPSIVLASRLALASSTAPAAVMAPRVPVELVQLVVGRLPAHKGVGVSGWTYEGIRQAAALDGRVLIVLTCIAELLAAGCLGAARVWTMGRLVALEKANGEVRPVVVGESLLRLLTKIVLQTAVPADVRIHEEQYAHGVAGGVERAAMSAQAALTAGKTLLCTDVRNAYNTISRREILRATSRRCPRLLACAWYLLREESILLTQGSKGWGDWWGVRGREGVQQGSPLATYLFCLTVADAIEQASIVLSVGHVFGAVGAPKEDEEALLDALSVRFDPRKLHEEVRILAGRDCPSMLRGIEKALRVIVEGTYGAWEWNSEDREAEAARQELDAEERNSDMDLDVLEWGDRTSEGGGRQWTREGVSGPHQATPEQVWVGDVLRVDTYPVHPHTLPPTILQAPRVPWMTVLDVTVAQQEIKRDEDGGTMVALAHAHGACDPQNAPAFWLSVAALGPTWRVEPGERGAGEIRGFLALCAAAAVLGSVSAGGTRWTHLYGFFVNRSTTRTPGALAFADDVTLLVPRMAESFALEFFAEGLRSVGLELRREKCVVINGGGIPGVKQAIGTMICGVPVGPEAYIITETTSLASQVTEAVGLGLQLPVECAFAYVSGSAGSRLTHILRAVPTRLLGEMIRRCDEALKDAVLTLLGSRSATLELRGTVVVGDSSRGGWRSICERDGMVGEGERALAHAMDLPWRLGGLGVRSLRGRATAARAGGRALAGLDPFVEMDEETAQWLRSTLGDASKVSQGVVQRLLDDRTFWMYLGVLALEEHLPCALLCDRAGYTTRGATARLEASWRLQLASRGGSSWMTSVAKRGSRPLDSLAFTHALAGRAGLHCVSSGIQCQCGEQNCSRAHYLACRSSLRQARHDVLVEEMQRTIRGTGGAIAQTEVNCIGVQGPGRIDLVCSIDGKMLALDVSIVHADLCTKPLPWETRLVQVSAEIASDQIGGALGGFVREACHKTTDYEQAARSARPINDLVRGRRDSPSFDVDSGKATHTDPLGVRASMERMATAKVRKYGEEVTVNLRGQAPRRAKVVPFVLTAGGVLHEKASELVTQVAFSARSRQKLALRGLQGSDARDLLLAVIGRVVAIGSMLIMRERASEEE